MASTIKTTNINTPDGTGSITFDRPIITASGVGAGKIVQVVQAVKTDVFSTNSTSYVDITGLSATITPSAATSKIACDHTHATFAFSPMYIDSPSSTSALTYKIQVKSEGSAYYARINRCHEDSATQHSRNVSTFTVMEIGA